MGICNRQIFSSLLISVLVIGFASNLSLGHESQHFGSSTTPVLEDSLGHSHCGHEHHHHHHKHHYQHEERFLSEKKLPEELAEEEDLKLYGFGAQHGHHHYHDNDHGHGASELSGVGLWIHAMGCSLLVSLASLICLMILPLIFMGGKPSKTFVDSLALFGAGAMLGDAFLHQLPHTFGGGQSHSHDHHEGHVHIPADSGQHAHSIEDLSAGLSILAGILFFLLIEKLVRYVEELSGGDNAWPHVHHHHHHRTSKKLKDDEDATENLQDHSSADKNGSILNPPSDDKLLDEISNDSLQGKEQSAPAIFRKRNSITSVTEDKPGVDAANGFSGGTESAIQKEIAPSANLVFGYLNLFSDGVHNFTDGMALGSAFLLYGSVGGWSRTVFLLAHELPQEIGDFGILVRSGFSVSKALAFNFLSALMALVGTALALAWGEDPGQSSLIEGFTAGGFIYIAVAGVLTEMNNGCSSLKSTAIQVTSLIVGMTIALCISLVE